MSSQKFRQLRFLKFWFLDRGFWLHLRIEQIAKLLVGVQLSHKLAACGLHPRPRPRLAQSCKRTERWHMPAAPHHPGQRYRRRWPLRNAGDVRVQQHATSTGPAPRHHVAGNLTNRMRSPALHHARERISRTCTWIRAMSADRTAVEMSLSAKNQISYLFTANEIMHCYTVCSYQHVIIGKALGPFMP